MNDQHAEATASLGGGFLLRCRRQLRLDKVHLQELKREIGRVIEKDRPRERERSLAKADTLMRAFEAALRALSRPEMTPGGGNPLVGGPWRLRPNEKIRAEPCR